MAIYARISSDVSGEKLGVTRQLEDCRRLAAERGWVVGDEYVDNDVSAYSGKHRPEYARMLEDLESGARDAEGSFGSACSADVSAVGDVAVRAV